jgi:hypothetical protein
MGIVLILINRYVYQIILLIWQFTLIRYVKNKKKNQNDLENSE